MACKVKAEMKLCIYDDDEGYESWEKGDNILLKLKDKEGYKFGTIETIVEDHVFINAEFGTSQMIRFDDIEGFCRL